MNDRSDSLLPPSGLNEPASSEISRADAAGELKTVVEARVAALCRLAELATELGAESIARNAQSLAERVSEGRFYVACVGQFKRGKSTLLNALVGRGVLPAGIVPVTTVPTILRYGRHLGARVLLRGAEWMAIPVSAVEEYVAEWKNPENAKGVLGLEVFIPSPLLSTGMCLVDTPGLGSVFVGNTAATRAFLPHIDAAIVVIGADPPLSGEELQLAEEVARQVDELLIVLNKADRVSETERSAAVAFARSLLEERLKRIFPVIFEVSALERLEGRAPERDWPKLLTAIDHLVQESGCSLVREAGDRGLRRATHQLQAMIREERDALRRPVEESQRRLAELRKTLEQADRATRDLGVLFGAEQRRLAEVFAKRRRLFLGKAPEDVRREFAERLLSAAHYRNGPAYRRELNRRGQQIVAAHLAPWLDQEGEYAEQEFRRTASRFVEMGDEFLRRTAAAGLPEVSQLSEEIDAKFHLRAESTFRFHAIERVAAPASPLLFVADLLRGWLGLRKGILQGTEGFLDQLLEVNSARVQSEVEERVRESGKELEAKIKALLGEVATSAERALDRARSAQAEGGPAVASALSRLDTVEAEVLRLGLVGEIC